MNDSTNIARQIKASQLLLKMTLMIQHCVKGERKKLRGISMLIIAFAQFPAKIDRDNLCIRFHLLRIFLHSVNEKVLKHRLLNYLTHIFDQLYH